MTEPQDPAVQVIRVSDPQGRGGLYNMLEPKAFERLGALMPLLGLNPDAAGHIRARDCWIERDTDGALRLRLYTRMGGGNRDDYAEMIEVLRRLPEYDADADEDFDSTYASFYFRVPEHMCSVLEPFAVAPRDMRAWWMEMADRLANSGGA